MTSPTPSATVPTAQVNSPHRLQRRFLGSLAWSAAGKWGAQVVIWGSTVVVARQLSPADYGLVGMAVVFLGLATTVSELGIGTAVVTLSELGEARVAQLNTLAVWAGTGAFLVTVAMAVPLSKFFHASALPGVLLALGTTFVIGAFRAVPTALLQRSLRFRETSLNESLAAVASASTVVVLAVSGWRYWALVAGQVIGSVVQTLLTLRLARQPFARPRWAELRPVLTFSKQILIATLAWYAYSNADFAVAGRFLGQAALGVYSFGWTLVNLPAEKIGTLITSLTPAFLSEARRDAAELKRMLLHVSELLAITVLPATVGLALVASDLVPFVFGTKWLAAVPIVQLLALYSAPRALQPVLHNALVVLDDAAYSMWTSIVCAVVFPLTFWYCSRWGAVAIAGAWVALFPLLLGAYLHRLLARNVLTLGDYFHALRPAIASTGAMAVAVLVLKHALPASIGVVTAIAAQVVVGAAAFMLYIGLVHRSRFQQLLDVVRRSRSV